LHWNCIGFALGCNGFVMDLNWMCIGIASDLHGICNGFALYLR
jgi:hypothetical protein